MLMRETSVIGMGYDAMIESIEEPKEFNRQIER